MKFCENCGIQLEDNAVFCEECGAKQDSVEQTQPEVSTPEVEINTQPTKLSATCTPAKKQIASWLLVLILIICSPVVLFELIWWLPDFIYMVLMFIIPLIALFIMWKKRTWKPWIKLGCTLAYIITYFI